MCSASTSATGARTTSPSSAASSPPGVDLRNAYDFLDAKVKKPLERIPGVAEVELFGAQRREVDIYLRLDDIRRHRVDVGSLFRRLDSANLNVSLGRVEDGHSRYEAITRGVMRSLDDIRNFPVDGRGLKLHEIADIVYDKPASTRRPAPERQLCRWLRHSQDLAGQHCRDGRGGFSEKIAEIEKDPALEGTQHPVLVGRRESRSPSRSTDCWKPESSARCSPSSCCLYFCDGSRPRLSSDSRFRFRWSRPSASCICLGKTLNVLSMMGLMLAAGMLVDNAVVVLESIYQNIEKGMDRVTAAIVGTKEVISAVFAATLTSIIIFVPLVFGKKTNYSIWLADTGTSIIIALLCSLFISLTLIPLAVAKFLPAKHIAFVADKTRKHRLRDAYMKSVSAGLCGIRLSSVSSLCRRLLAAAFTQLKKIPDNSPEAQDLQDLTIQYDFSENFHYAKIERDYVNPVEKFLLANKERFKIKDVTTWYGNNSAHTRCPSTRSESRSRN